MPSITKISITVDAITAGFVKKLTKLSGVVTKFIGTLGSLATSLLKLSTIAFTAFTGALAAIATKSVLAAGGLETLQVQFEVLLGSAKKAADRMKELKEFSKTTPFQIKDIATASRILERATKGALSAGKGLRMVGDAAAAANQPMEEVALHIARVFSAAETGAKAGESLRRLQELQIISEDALRTFNELQEQGQKGAAVWAVISKELNKSAGAMEKLSKTMKGLWSTLKDNLNLAFAELGKILMPIVKVLFTMFISKLQKLGTLIEKNKKAIQSFVINGLEKLIPVFKQIGDVAIAAFDIIMSLFSEHGPAAVDDMLDSIQRFLAKVEFGIKNFPKVWSAVWEKIKISAKSFGVDIIAVLLTPFRFVGENIVAMFKGIWKAVSDSLSQFIAEAQVKGAKLGADLIGLPDVAAQLEKQFQELKKQRPKGDFLDQFQFKFVGFVKAFGMMQDDLRQLFDFKPEKEIAKVNEKLKKIKQDMDEFMKAKIQGNAKKAAEILDKMKAAIKDAGKPLVDGGKKIIEGAKELQKAKEIGLPKLAIKGTQAAADLLNRENQMVKVNQEQLKVLKEIRDNTFKGDPAINVAAFGFVGGM